MNTIGEFLDAMWQRAKALWRRRAAQDAAAGEQVLAQAEAERQQMDAAEKAVRP